MVEPLTVTRETREALEAWCPARDAPASRRDQSGDQSIRKPSDQPGDQSEVLPEAHSADIHRDQASSSRLKTPGTLGQLGTLERFKARALVALGMAGALTAAALATYAAVLAWHFRSGPPTLAILFWAAGLLGLALDSDF